MKAFFQSHAGKGTVAVYLAGVLLAWPPALSWLVAVVMLVLAVRQFRDSFREIEAVEAVAPATLDSTEAGLADPSPLRGDARPCDVKGVMATLAAQALRSARETR